MEEECPNQHLVHSSMVSSADITSREHEILHVSRFFFATVLSVYNKWMFSPKQFGFPYPLFATAVQMFIQSGLAAGLRYGAPQHFKPDHNPTRNDYGYE